MAKTPVDPATRDDETQEAVAPARERNAHRLECASLLEVIADAERKRIEQVLAKFLARRRRARRRQPWPRPRQEETLSGGNRIPKLLARCRCRVLRRHASQKGCVRRKCFLVRTPRRVLVAKA